MELREYQAMITNATSRYVSKSKKYILANENICYILSFDSNWLKYHIKNTVATNVRVAVLCLWNGPIKIEKIIRKNHTLVHVRMCALML